MSSEVVQRLDGVTSALEELGTVLAGEEDLGRVLQRSVAQVMSAVPGADLVSVTVLRDGQGETAAASDARVWSIDSDQYAAGQGPCLEAASTGRVVRTSVEQAVQRYPRFADSARRAGVESYLACPLMIDTEFAGSLNLYSSQPHGFADFDVALLRLYLAAAVAAISSARRYHQARGLAGQLKQALESRAVIDQAVGAIMIQQGIGAKEAFQELSRRSQDTNVKVRDLAAQMFEDAGESPAAAAVREFGDAG